ncbi:MAG: hypothetical protein ACI4TJ_07625 [Candidatus Cryptobacteroides sp.]
MRRLDKYWSALLLALFGFFFASTNLFTHVHEGPEGRIVHSHPWSAKSHSHTDAQYQIIQLLSSNIFQTGEEEHLEVCFLPIEQANEIILPDIRVGRIIHHILGLRAPPASLS